MMGKSYDVTFMYADYEDGNEGLYTTGDDEYIAFYKDDKFAEWLIEPNEGNREAMHKMLDAWLDGVEYTDAEYTEIEDETAAD